MLQRFIRIASLMMIVAVLSASLAAAQGTGLQEQLLGEPLGTPLGTLYNDVVAGPDGPVVFWSDGMLIYAARWDGAAWQMIGDDAGVQDGMLESVAVGEDGSAVVTYLSASEDGSTGELHAVLFDGTAWTPLGEKINLYASGTYNFDEAVVMTAEGPVVAWREAEEFMQPDQLYVHRWDGTAWQPLGDGESLNNDPAQAVDLVALAAAPEGGVVLASDESGQTFVRRWDGTAWQMLPDVPEEGTVSLMRAAVGADGSIALYRYFEDGRHDVQQLAPDAAEWAALAGIEGTPGLSAGSYLDEADLRVAEDGSVLFAWSNGSSGTAGLGRWNGSAWEAGEPVSFMPQPVSFKASTAIGADDSLTIARLNTGFLLEVAQYTGG